MGHYNLEFPVTVLSVLKCTFGFAFCPVAVYTMILCSCRPLLVVFVTHNELSLTTRGFSLLVTTSLSLADQVRI
jgi:hypothetical protein